MPAEAAEKIDITTLKKAVAWSLKYLLDPKRGAGKLPTIKEIKQQFPQITSIEQIENWVRNPADKASIEEVLKDSQRVTEVLEKLEEKEQTSKETVAKAPYIRPVTPPTRKVSALGVLAELESIEPILKKHRQEAAGKISRSLQQQVEAILPKVTRGFKRDQIPQISQEIAAETARETLENVAKIQDLSQVNQVIADSLTQSIIAHPQIQEVKTTEEKLYAQSFEQTRDIVQVNSQDLEKAAVLGSIAQIAELKKPGQKTLGLISDQVTQTIEAQAPLTPPATQSYLAGALGTYLTTYVDNFEKTLAPSLSKGQIPSFEALQKIKDTAHNQTVAQVAVNIAKSKEGKVINTKIGFNPMTARVAAVFGLASPSTITQVMSKQGVSTYKPRGVVARGMNLILSVPSLAGEAHQAAFLHDQEKFNSELSKVTTKVEELKRERSLTYPKRIEYFSALRRQKKLQDDQRAQTKKSGRIQRFRRLFTNLHPTALNTVSQAAWGAYQVTSGEFPGVYAPQIMVANGQALGSLSFIGPSGVGFNLGSIAAVLKGEGAVIGMGNPAIGWARRAWKAAGLAWGGALFYFWSLGQAAFTGFLIGAGIGMAAGGSVGFALALATGPLFPLTVVPFTLGGIFVGGTVGGIAGGLIGLGMASGTTTAVTTGVGVGVGGTTGAVVGGILGSALGPFGTFFGAMAGAYIGSVLGGALGYAIGHYVIGTIGVPATGALAGAAIGFYFGGPLGSLIGAGIGWLATGGWMQVRDFFTGAAGATSTAATGVIGAIGSFATGLASGIWGGIAGAAGATFGFLSGAANFIVGGLSGLSIPASAVAIPVAGGIGAVAIGGTIVGIVTASSFFAAETDQPVTVTPGENEFFTLTKTADPAKITNNGNLPKDITFTITFTAKDKKLTGVEITDTLRVDTKPPVVPFDVKTDKNGNSFSPVPTSICPSTFNPSQTCSFQFTITANSLYSDSVIIDVVTAKATPEGESQVTDTFTVTVIIGNPPAQCPRGWPAIDDISQGPEGATSHADEVYGGYEAIDIAQGVGNDVYATVEGTVDLIYTKGGNTLDQRIRVRPTSCAGLATVNYWHLSAVLVSEGDTITWGQKIGKTGDAGSGPHTHYQFNEIGDRSFKMAPPYIPRAVARTCDSISDCNVHIDSAP